MTLLDLATISWSAPSCFQECIKQLLAIVHLLLERLDLSVELLTRLFLPMELTALLLFSVDLLLGCSHHLLECTKLLLEYTNLLLAILHPRLLEHRDLFVELFELKVFFCQPFHQSLFDFLQEL
jgi:hypothetical protein